LLMAAVSTGAVALALVHRLPTLPGAVAAGAAGVLVYGLALRLSKALEPGDRDRLLQLERQLPPPLRIPYRRTISWLFPPA
jgi:hypothetical protein